MRLLLSQVTYQNIFKPHTHSAFDEFSMMFQAKSHRQTYVSTTIFPPNFPGTIVTQNFLTKFFSVFSSHFCSLLISLFVLNFKIKYSKRHDLALNRLWYFVLLFIKCLRSITIFGVLALFFRSLRIIRNGNQLIQY